MFDTKSGTKIVKMLVTNRISDIPTDFHAKNEMALVHWSQEFENRAQFWKGLWHIVLFF